VPVLAPALVALEFGPVELDPPVREVFQEVQQLPHHGLQPLVLQLFVEERDQFVCACHDPGVQLVGQPTFLVEALDAGWYERLVAEVLLASHV